MKHAITADLQFDTQSRFSTINADGITTRLADSLDCFEWIVDEALKHGCETLFVLGDLFDSRTQIDVSVIDRVCRVFHTAARAIHIYIIVGNHDSYLRTPKLNSLQMLAGCAVVIEKPTRVHGFNCVPWHDDPEEVHAMLRKAKEGEYLLTHATLKGAIPAVAEKGLPNEWFKRKSKPWKGVFLGDIHDPLVISEKPLIRYVGAPLQIHFGDAGGKRGFVIVDDAPGAQKHFSHIFIDNEVSPRFHILRNWEEEMPSIAKGDFVRVKAEDIDVAVELAESARECTGWVEAPAVPDHVVKARLKVGSGATDEEILAAYAKHMGVSTEALVAEGVKLMELARGSL